MQTLHLIYPCENMSIYQPASITQFLYINTQKRNYTLKSISISVTIKILKILVIWKFIDTLTQTHDNLLLKEKPRIGFSLVTICVFN